MDQAKHVSDEGPQTGEVDLQRFRFTSSAFLVTPTSLSGQWRLLQTNGGSQPPKQSSKKSSSSLLFDVDISEGLMFHDVDEFPSGTSLLEAILSNVYGFVVGLFTQEPQKNSKISVSYSHHRTAPEEFCLGRGEALKLDGPEKTIFRKVEKDQPSVS